jgi:hypothetical protein
MEKVFLNKYGFTRKYKGETILRIKVSKEAEIKRR